MPSKGAVQMRYKKASQQIKTEMDVNLKNRSLKRFGIVGFLDSITLVLCAALATNTTRNNPMNPWLSTSKFIIIIMDEISGNSNKNKMEICERAVPIHNCTQTSE
jgi:hypothetical protein